MKITTKIVQLFLLSSFSTYGAFEPSPEEIKEQQIGLSEWNSIAEDSPKMDRDEAFEKLGIGIRKTLKRSIYSIDQAKAVSQRLIDAMVSIPGHADYFVNQMKLAREKCVVENERRAKSGSNPYWGPYNDMRSSSINVLQNLPSPEAVRVLGELLYDLEDTQIPITKDSIPDAFGPPPNAILAADALRKLLDQAPVSEAGPQFRRRDLPIWQDWFEKVKAGNSTFRFKDNPTEYDLDGPASPQKLERIAKNRQRDEKREAGENGRKTAATTARSAEKHSGKGSIAAIAFVLSALTAAGCWWIRKSRGR